MNAIVADAFVDTDTGRLPRLSAAAAAFRETRDPRSMHLHAGVARAVSGCCGSPTTAPRALPC